jgi:hypothetical protein
VFWLVIIVGLGLWWWLGSKAKAKRRAQIDTEIFEDKRIQVAIHFPSMIWVKWTLGGMGIVYAGYVRRDDGPIWQWRSPPTDDTPDPAWKPMRVELDAGFEAQVETAFQRFVHSPHATAISADAWLDRVRVFVPALCNVESVAIIGPK